MAPFMINIVRILNLLGVNINFFLIFLIFGVWGCAPSYTAWVSSRDAMVGSNYLRHIPSSCRGSGLGCGDYFWSPANKENLFYKIEREGADKRLYVKWIRGCYYSVLIDGRGVILSWRLESGRNSCYVF